MIVVIFSSLLAIYLDSSDFSLSLVFYVWDQLLVAECGIDLDDIRSL